MSSEYLVTPNRFRGEIWDGDKNLGGVLIQLILKIMGISEIVERKRVRWPSLKSSMLRLHRKEKEKE